MIYPKILSDLIHYFKKLPGVGEKSAERMALFLLNFEEEDITSFSHIISKIKSVLHSCPICGNITDEKECYICSNIYREKKLICVVEDYKSIFMFEKMGNFKGVYHVLGGLISPIDGIGPDDINIAQLIKRCDKIDKKIELIIALKPSIEGETTTKYIRKILDNQNISVSRLSYGIPIGADIDYLDVLTLERAFEDRKTIE